MPAMSIRWPRSLLWALAFHCAVAAFDVENCELSGVCPASDRGCRAWRQTAGCTPEGRREARSDRSCSDVIATGASGYCECADGTRARASTCVHSSFTCERACAVADSEVCFGGWRQSADCEAEGLAEPSSSLRCDAPVPAGVAGYCECGRGRRVRRSGCDAERDEREPLMCSEACAEPESLYDVLNVARDCDEAQVKKAFRELSRVLHPDKVRQRSNRASGGDTDAEVTEATIRFTEVREAYGVLSDSSRREVYEAGGSELLSKFDANKDSVLRAHHTEARMDVSLEALYSGANMTVQIERRSVCRGCADGEFERNRHRCAPCSKSCPAETIVAKVRMGPFLVDQNQQVPSQQRCQAKPQSLTFRIEKGTRGGHVVRFPGQSSQVPGALKGDVHLTLMQADHERFERRGDDLHTTATISLKDALTGFERTLKHLDLHKVALSAHVGQIIKPGHVQRIAGQGMPRPGQPGLFGSLNVEYVVNFPQALDKDTRDFINDQFPDV